MTSDKDEDIPVLDYCPRSSVDGRRFIVRHLRLLALVMGVLIVAYWILCPSLHSPRELSPRTHCAANLKGIVMSCQVYAQEHDGVLPPNLDALFAGTMTPKGVICPVSGNRYFYISGQTTRDDPRNVVAFESLANHDSQGACMVFLDGHVEFCRPGDFEANLAETAARLAQRANPPPAQSTKRMPESSPG